MVYDWSNLILGVGFRLLIGGFGGKQIQVDNVDNWDIEVKCSFKNYSLWIRSCKLRITSGFGGKGENVTYWTCGTNVIKYLFLIYFLKQSFLNLINSNFAKFSKSTIRISKNNIFRKGLT